MLVKQIKQILGGDIGRGNTKMPCTTFGLSTAFCNVGCKLKELEGSVCSGCYAERLENFRPSVKQGWTNRTMMVHEACKTTVGMQQWVDAFVTRLDKIGGDYHRWHDSGDLQSFEHLLMIVDVATRLPNISFWLPTKEKGIVNRYLREVGEFPSNLTVRLSMPMIDTIPTDSRVPTSTVHKVMPPTGHVCPASKQGNACLDCRACWNSSIANVSYPKH